MKIQNFVVNHESWPVKLNPAGVCEAGRSGSEKLKKCPTPAPAVLWFCECSWKKTIKKQII